MNATTNASIRFTRTVSGFRPETIILIKLNAGTFWCEELRRETPYAVLVGYAGENAYPYDLDGDEICDLGEYTFATSAPEDVIAAIDPGWATEPMRVRLPAQIC